MQTSPRVVWRFRTIGCTLHPSRLSIPRLVSVSIRTLYFCPSCFDSLVCAFSNHLPNSPVSTTILMDYNSIWYEVPYKCKLNCALYLNLTKLLSFDFKFRHRRIVNSLSFGQSFFLWCYYFGDFIVLRNGVDPFAESLASSRGALDLFRIEIHISEVITSDAIDYFFAYVILVEIDQRV